MDVRKKTCRGGDNGNNKENKPSRIARDAQARCRNGNDGGQCGLQSATRRNLKAYRQKLAENLLICKHSNRSKWLSEKAQLTLEETEEYDSLKKYFDCYLRIQAVIVQILGITSHLESLNNFAGLLDWVFENEQDFFPSFVAGHAHIGHEQIFANMLINELEKLEDKRTGGE